MDRSDVSGLERGEFNVSLLALAQIARALGVPVATIDSVQTIQKSRVHSQKPDQFDEIIERLYDGPSLELCARHPRAGWTSFGNDPALTEVA